MSALNDLKTILQNGKNRTRYKVITEEIKTYSHLETTS
jgi:hypothetical protein